MRPLLLVPMLTSLLAGHATLAGDTGCPGDGDCCTANGSPGCDDETCCDLVCAGDSFCCDVEWDTQCANAALATCDPELCPNGCGTFECADGATPENEPCGFNENGGCNLEPPAFGSISVGETICGTAFFDGSTRDTDWFVFEVPEGEQGIYQLTVSAGFEALIGFIPSPPCPAPAFLPEPEFVDCGMTGTAQSCLPPGTYTAFIAPNFTDTVFCETPQSVYNLTLDLIEILPDGCPAPESCAPDAGDCLLANGTPGCDDLCGGVPCEVESCCAEVCFIDQFCCDVEWDDVCAFRASTMCGTCDELDCAPGAVLEDELCGLELNNGCSQDPPMFGSITVGDTICGSVYYDGEMRDLDWFTFTAPAEGLYRVSMTAEFPWVSGVADVPPCGGPFLEFSSGVCGLTGTYEVCLQAGDTYSLFVAPQFFEVIDCEVNDRYNVTLELIEETECIFCGDPETGDCFDANGEPYCDNNCGGVPCGGDCCGLVCKIDPACCDLGWDVVCRSLAQNNCNFCDELENCEGDIFENEPCGEDINGGCNNQPPTFTDIELPDGGSSLSICGTAWANEIDGFFVRDTDWYRFTIPPVDLDTDPGIQLTLEMTGQFPPIVAIQKLDAEGGCNIGGFFLDSDTAEPCQVATITVCLQPGNYAIFAAPNIFDGYTCDKGLNNYKLTVHNEGLVDCPKGPCFEAEGDCFVDNGTPACNGECDGVPCAGCCESVCDFDQFCCSIGWDQQCADLALEICQESIPNDFCEEAIPVTNGEYDFNTVGATTDGPPLPEECDEGSGLEFNGDVWYLYTAKCSGTVTVSTCFAATFNTRLAAYLGDQCFGELIACNDNGFSCLNGTSVMEFEAVCNETYLIRLGGNDDQQGTGTVTFSCAGKACPDCLGDLNNDGLVDGADLGLLLGDWGTPSASGIGDLNNDGLTDGADLGLLLGAWGPCS